MDLDLPTRNNPNSPPLRKTAKEGPPDEEESQYIFNEICGALASRQLGRIVEKSAAISLE
jgi:hypothetical protein